MFTTLVWFLLLFLSILVAFSAHDTPTDAWPTGWVIPLPSMRGA